MAVLEFRFVTGRMLVLMIICSRPSRKWKVNMAIKSQHWLA